MVISADAMKAQNVADIVKKTIDRYCEVPVLVGRLNSIALATNCSVMLYKFHK